MRKRLTENDAIFDGFAYRGFIEAVDGWRNEMPDESYYPSVAAARDTIALFDELREAKRRIWELERRLGYYEKVDR